VEDVKREPLGYDRLLIGADLLGARLAARHPAGRGGRPAAAQRQRRGGGVLRAAIARARAGDAELHRGLANLRSACATAQIATIVTARAFVDQAKLGET
jgi:acyl-[acyl-carrier-protein]-phospholipid O-acyltransferase/long-chain-fatty-acid--[acyl-carrier-protein] ligase